MSDRSRIEIGAQVDTGMVFIRVGRPDSKVFSMSPSAAKVIAKMLIEAAESMETIQALEAEQ